MAIDKRKTFQARLVQQLPVNLPLSDLIQLDWTHSLPFTQPVSSHKGSEFATSAFPSKFYNPFLPVIKTRAMGKYRLIRPRVTLLFWLLVFLQCCCCEMTLKVAHPLDGVSLFVAQPACSKLGPPRGKPQVNKILQEGYTLTYQSFSCPGSSLPVQSLPFHLFTVHWESSLSGG